MKRTILEKGKRGTKKMTRPTGIKEIIKKLKLKIEETHMTRKK